MRVITHSATSSRPEHTSLPGAYPTRPIDRRVRHVRGVVLRVRWLVLGLLVGLACLAATWSSNTVYAQAAPAAPAAMGQVGEPTLKTWPPQLLRSQIDVYLISGRYRRHVVSPQVFNNYRFRDEWVQQVSDDDLTRIALGPDLLAGPVLRAPDGTLWVVYEGSRRQIAGADAWEPLNLSPDDAVPASQALLESYPSGRPLGNPPRPWLLLPIGALALGATWLWWRGGTWRAVAVLLAGSTALKAGYALLYPWIPDGPDSHSYTILAHYLMGGGSIMQDGPQFGLLGLTSPLYPVLLALLSRLFPGASATGTLLGWKLIQVGLTVPLALAAGDMARLLYGRRAGVMAVVIAATTPLWFYSAELIQYEIWLAVTITGALWALLRFGRAAGGGPGASSAHPFRWLALASLLYGLAFALQQKVLVLALPAVLYLLWVLWRQGMVPVPQGSAGSQEPSRPERRTARRWPHLGALALFGLGALLPMGLWGLRNEAVHGVFLVGGASGGIVMWQGNHPGASGGYELPPRPPAYYDRLRQYPDDSIFSQSAVFRDLALDYIRQRPDEFAVRALTKLERFWWTLTPDRLGEYGEARSVAMLGNTIGPVWLVFLSKLLHLASLLLLGAGLLWGHRVRSRPGVRGTGSATGSATAGRLLVVGSVLVFWGMHVLFFVEPRYRLPIEPLLAVIVGVGLVWLRDTVPAVLWRWHARAQRAGAPLAGTGAGTNDLGFAATTPAVTADDELTIAGLR